MEQQKREKDVQADSDTEACPVCKGSGELADLGGVVWREMPAYANKGAKAWGDIGFGEGDVPEDREARDWDDFLRIL